MNEQLVMRNGVIKPASQHAADMAAERAALNEWQPIETAPKDGTEILLGHGNGVWVDQWLDDLECWENCSEDETPSHWMPLPDPPETSK